MNANDVIESYVTDVAVRLPRKQRNDVAFELRALLNEGLQDKAAAAGRPADADDPAIATEFLRAFGRPEDVAARYRPTLTIIDPADGPKFLRAAVIGLALIWSLGLFACLQQPIHSADDLIRALTPVVGKHRHSLPLVARRARRVVRPGLLVAPPPAANRRRLEAARGRPPPRRPHRLGPGARRRPLRGGAPGRRGDPRRRRSLFRRRRRQGHRDLLRHRQRDRARARTSGSATPSPAAARTATTTRRWASPRRARGSRSSATSSKWASTCRTSRSRVAGCGDMSGDVFGNGMLLSKAIKLVAAFDHRHIFLDPDPDPATSWDERDAPVRAAALELGRL